MSYEIGSSSSAKDLLDKIRVVAIARGWTVNTYSDVTASIKWLSLQSGTSYFNLIADNAAGDTSNPGGFITMYIATSYSSGAGYLDQPNASYKESHSSTQALVVVNSLVGPFTAYRIFSGADYIHVVVETSPDIFSFLALGKVAKYGTLTGGEYVSGSAWYYGDSHTNYPDSDQARYLFDASIFNGCSMNVRCEVDAKKYFDNSNDLTSNDRRVLGLIRVPNVNNINPIDCGTHLMFNRTPNLFNQITPLLPAIMYVGRGSDLFSPIGEIQDFRIVNMANYNPGDIVTFGSDEWVVFPAKQKTLVYNVYTSNIPSSANYGYAFKKVV